jgi:hypothetical protein
VHSRGSQELLDFLGTLVFPPGVHQNCTDSRLPKGIENSRKGALEMLDLVKDGTPRKHGEIPAGEEVGKTGEARDPQLIEFFALKEDEPLQAGDGSESHP